MNSFNPEERFRKIGDRLRHAYHAEKVILYGSYATRSACRDSDVDLFVIAPTTEKFFQRIASVKRLIRDIRQGLSVAPIILTPHEVEARKKAGDSFVKQILENGLPL